VPRHVLVTNALDDGEGTFRAAIALANADPTVSAISFHPGLKIELESGIELTGGQDLTIRGNQSTVDGADAGGTAFLATGGGDLSLVGLTFRDAPGEGVHVEVQESATGEVTISLVDVDIIGNQGHGLLVNDQEDPSSPEDDQPNPNGSPASLDVKILRSRFVRNGFSVSDRDGIRINEGGVGDLRFAMTHSLAQGNGADGTELDERGAGSVHIDVASTAFLGNGALDPEDLDDGFDIDEYHHGGIFGTVVLSSASNNFEEGFDFNENDPEDGTDAGELRIAMSLVSANGNGEEGIDLEEDDDFGNGGGLFATLDGITTVGNGGGDGGLKVREKEAGDLEVNATNVLARGNASSGIYLRESSGGDARISVDRALSNQNDPHGIELLESGGGALSATVARTTAVLNEGNGIFAEGGTVTLANVTLVQNAGGPTGGTATFLP
jgi:hypothetical protein